MDLVVPDAVREAYAIYCAACDTWMHSVDHNKAIGATDIAIDALREAYVLWLSDLTTSKDDVVAWLAYEWLDGRGNV